MSTEEIHCSSHAHGPSLLIVICDIPEITCLQAPPPPPQKEEEKKETHPCRGGGASERRLVFIINWELVNTLRLGLLTLDWIHSQGTWQRTRISAMRGSYLFIHLLLLLLRVSAHSKSVMVSWMASTVQIITIQLASSPRIVADGGGTRRYACGKEEGEEGAPEEDGTTEISWADGCCLGRYSTGKEEPS